MHLGRKFFIIKLWKWKSRFFKMSAPSAAPPRSFEHKYHQIQPAPADFSCSFQWCALNKKPQPLRHPFSGLMGPPDLFTGGGGGVFAGSPFWALIPLWIVRIFLPIALLVRRFLFQTDPEEGHEVFLQEKCPFSSSLYFYCWFNKKIWCSKVTPVWEPVAENN